MHMTYVNIMMEFLGYDLAFTGVGKGDPPNNLLLLYEAA